MRLKFGLVLAILTVGGTSTAFAQANCALPIPPAAPDGRDKAAPRVRAGIGARQG